MVLRLLVFLSVGQLSSLIGVSITSLRRWEKENRYLPCFRTLGGHRRYSLARIREDFFGEPRRQQERKTISYARVSSHDQKKDLVRQADVLNEYAEKKGWKAETIKDLESGVNYHKKGLTRLLGLVCRGQVERILLTHKDRLLRFGSPLIFKICEEFGTEVIIVKESPATSFEEELVGDVLEIMTVFRSKIYGRRSHLNRKKQVAA